MSELILPQSWQDWHIVGEIGEGSYGRVYRAEKENGGVKAVSAIKVIRVPSERSELLSLRREFRSEEELRRNLKEMVDGYANEIRTMYRLQGHTHLVSIQDHLVEELDDGFSWRIYIRMEYLQSFDDYAMTHTFSREEIIRLGISLCEALSACAENGILHRDVKPENLFVTESGQYKLGDFGIAKALDRTVSSYSSKGTFSYMAPEVFHGKPYDSRADLYSTGIILYKLANRNRDPFIDPEKQIITHQDRERAMNLRIQGEKLPAPIDADEKLSRVILKACEYEPKSRFESPDAMTQALKAIIQEKKPAVKNSSKKWIIPLCTAVILLIILGVIFMNHSPDLENRSVSNTPFPADIEQRIQEYCGVRYVLPEGFSPDTAQCTEDKMVWRRGNLMIGFQTDDQEFKPVYERRRTIGGFDADFNPELQETENNNRETFVYATYANPVQGKKGAVYIILLGPREEISDTMDEFVRMLDSSESLMGTSVLQGK